MRGYNAISVVCCARLHANNRVRDKSTFEAILRKDWPGPYYSDCTHEVLEVTDGYLVILSYNLCLIGSERSLLTEDSIAKPESCPLFDLAGFLLLDSVLL